MCIAPGGQKSGGNNPVGELINHEANCISTRPLFGKALCSDAATWKQVAESCNLSTTAQFVLYQMALYTVILSILHIK